MLWDTSDETFVQCDMPQGCHATGPTGTPADAIAEWNAVARLAKRGAKREREADIAEIVSGLVGQHVYIEWRDGSDWHWFDLRHAGRELVTLHGLIAPDGTEWRGSPFFARLRGIKSIRPLSNEEWGYE
jgi:hypothetical protein